ncbi:hypothetical protein [Pseudomonas sp. MGal98]|uniref:hypothetical protein n=1 Tax=Pseudomonas sp. MGal98 TaxID=3162460 RepID=UPI0032EC2161
MSIQKPQAPWLGMDTAPKDGRLVRLLVRFEENAIDDGDEPIPTVGQNNRNNDGVDRWQFVGWCWTHDEFTDGEGTPLGWLPMLEDAKTAAAHDVLAERQRQVNVEGYDNRHDDDHILGELALAAALYAIPYDAKKGGVPLLADDEIVALDLALQLSCGWHLKPEPDARKRLIKAGALILAEIERLDRLQSGSPAGQNLPQQEADQ